MTETPAKTTQPFELEQIRLARYRLAPRLFERLAKKINEARTPNKEDNLSDQEVEEKCFQLLGLLEEFYRIPPLDSKIREAFVPDERASLRSRLDAVLRKTTQTRREYFMNSADTIKDEELFPEEDFSKLSEEEKKERKLRRLNEHHHQQRIEKEITNLLVYPQVRARFQKEFSGEWQIYHGVKSKIKEARTIDDLITDCRLAIYQIYLVSTQQNNGKLVQTAIDEIVYFQGKLTQLEESRIELRRQASVSALGYLETQKLLEYKRQLNEMGFVLTPSREAFLERIRAGILSGKKVFLVGSTGTGKSELAFRVAGELTGGYEIIPWHEGSTPRDVHGYPKISIDPITGQPYSHIEPGPAPRAKQFGKVLIHSEATGAPTRVLLELKDTLFKDNGIMQIFTGNPKDERTANREEMDPAILRELSGIEVTYMPASEMKDIILAMLIEENGVLKLGSSELKYIEQLCKAAEIMQKIHNRQFGDFLDMAGDSQEVKNLKTSLRAALGIDSRGNTESTLNNNFLDPGTLFKLFSEWQLAQARGQSFAEYMQLKLNEFITDPKTLSMPEERKILQKILHAFGLITNASGETEVFISKQPTEKGYTLPSEMVQSMALSDENPMGEQAIEKPAEISELQKKEQAEWLRVLGVKDIPIPPLPDYVTPEVEEKIKAMGMELVFMPQLNLGTLNDLKQKGVEVYLSWLEENHPNWHSYESIMGNDQQKNDHTNMMRNLKKSFWQQVKDGNIAFPTMPGVWLAIESMPKPDQENQYQNSAITSILQLQDRFNVSHDQASSAIASNRNKILQQMGLSSDLEVRMPSSLELNLYFNRKGYGVSDTAEWSNTVDMSSRVLVGDSDFGGAASFYWALPDERYSHIGFRIAVVLGN